MELDEQRRAENFLIMCPLRDIEDADILAALANLIQDHDHLREKLLTEPDRRKRRGKLDAMRPYLNFNALTCDDYEMAEVARSCGVQPIYREQEEIGRILMPTSRIHEVN
jgi:hypothetical protein